MAIYHLSAQIIGKGSGRSAVAAAAYRHCAKMEREETAEEIDYSRKGGKAHSEFTLPKDAPNWIASYADAHSVVGASQQHKAGLGVAQTLVGRHEIGALGENTDHGQSHTTNGPPMGARRPSNPE